MIAHQSNSASGQQKLSLQFPAIARLPRPKSREVCGEVNGLAREGKKGARSRNELAKLTSLWPEPVKNSFELSAASGNVLALHVYCAVTKRQHRPPDLMHGV
jgi:hypothetical protein